MWKIVKWVIWYSLLGFATAWSVFAQERKPDSAIKWQPVIGHEKEFVVFMPSGFRTVVDNSKNFGRDRTGLVTAHKTVTVTRLINGTLLSLYYYEADGEAMFNFLASHSKLPRAGDGLAGKFRIKRFAGVVKSRHVKRHYFIDKGRLYVVSSYSNRSNDPIAEAFLASVRVAEGDSHNAPNAVSGSTSTSLPRITEVEPELMPDTVRFSETEVDRDAVILFQPEFRSLANAGAVPQSGRVIATALLTSSGAVKNVKTSGTAGFELQRAFAEAVKKVLFVPAEKDGKLVSVEKTFSWEMTVEVRREIRVLN